MPYADSAATAHRWATEPAIDLWALFAGDLTALQIDELEVSLEGVRADGGRVAVIRAPGTTPTGPEVAMADLLVTGPAAPSPFGLLAALEASGVEDVRRLGVAGGSTAVLEAAHRAGAGAIVGVAEAHQEARRALLAGEPDLIVDAPSFGAAHAERWSSGRAHRQRVLLNPGPAVVSDRVHRAVAGPDLCHREPEYTELFAAIRTKLLRVAELPDDWAVALIAGSGTAAMEAMTGALVRRGRRLLVCENGHYGERLARIAKRLGVDVVSVTASSTTPIDPAAVEAALAADPAIDAVVVVHHETTTGLLNPVDEIASITNARGVLLGVDAISSFGAEELRLEGSGIDLVAATANKCLHGLPGASLVLLSPRGQQRAREVPPKSLYLDIPGYLDAQARSTVPFTPATPALYGLDAALDELLDQGAGERRAHYRARMAFLDGELDRLGLVPVVAPLDRSASVRSIPLPPGVSYRALHDAVKADGYVIYAGLGESAASSFRVCALGNVEIDALAGFIDSLARCLAGSASTSTIVEGEPAA